MATTITPRFGSGHANLAPAQQGTPTLAGALLDMADALLPAWSAALTVTTHVVTLASAGTVLAVDATTATAAGGKTVQSQATPAAGTVQVEYDSDGIATLTFNATDAVTAAKVLVLDQALIRGT